MPLFSVFKSLVGKHVAVHLREGTTLHGVLSDADVFLNLKLGIDRFTGSSPAEMQFLKDMKRVFVRGSSVKYVTTEKTHVNVGSLEDATRRSFLYKTMGAAETEENRAEDD
jgi:small nuclear ribonucleoprotein (snRNP)-like protein